MTPKQTMLRAAELLNEDAELTRESCQRAGDTAQWVCVDCVRDEAGHCNARRTHDERRQTAAALLAMAEAFA